MLKGGTFAIGFFSESIDPEMFTAGPRAVPRFADAVAALDGLENSDAQLLIGGADVAAVPRERKI